MDIEIVTVPCRSDNYAYLVQDRNSGRTAVIDAPEAAPIAAALREAGWNLAEIWLTHHHDDHVAGVADLRSEFGADVVGHAEDAARLPPLDREVRDGETFDFAGAEVHVLDVSGHTRGHIAFHLPAVSAAFTADSLMALGCGRIFEGTPEMMWRSLQKLADLPPQTEIYSGHEYTEKNRDFAVTIEGDNTLLQNRSNQIDRLRARGEPTVPALLSEELATNPMLRAGEPSVKKALGMEDASDLNVFAEIRGRRDRF